MTGAPASQGGDARPERDDRAGHHDPVLHRRERVRRAVRWGQRLGYALFGLFGALVVVGFVSGFSAAVTTVAVAALVGGSVVLAPSVVVAYAVKAADRADADDDWR